MDPSNIPAAGSRATKQTFDQAPSVRQTNQNRSDIFNTQSQQSQPITRTVQRPKTDIFGTDQTPQQRTQDVRKNNTNQSSIFATDNSANNTHTNSKPNQTYDRSQKEIKQYQAKNNEHRQQDHGKEFLFGKSDFNEYKSLKRAQTQQEFKPKLEYDPANRRYQELYGNEIAKEHLPTKPVKLEANNSAKQKQKQQVEQDPSTRKQLENASTVFGDSPIKRTSTKVDKLEASTSKWNNVGGQSKNDVKEFDPDTYAKERKEKELGSTIFGESTVKKQPIKQEETTNGEQQKQPKQQQQQQKPKERLIPNNQTWQQTDSVKNMKDFNPSQSQISGEADAEKKKHDTFKSSLDTHQYQPQQIPTKEKISNKNLRYKQGMGKDDKGTKKDSKKPSKQPAQQQQQQQQQVVAPSDELI